MILNGTNSCSHRQNREMVERMRHKYQVYEVSIKKTER